MGMTHTRLAAAKEEVLAGLAHGFPAPGIEKKAQSTQKSKVLSKRIAKGARKK